MTDRSTLHGSNTFLATIPASLGANRWAVAICIASFVGFCGLIPFAGIQLPRIEAFIPIYESTFALNYLVTAGAMFVGFRRSHVRAVLVLGSGYLFTSLMAVAHLLTFPGLFSSGDLLGVGHQANAWLDTFRHAAFPLFAVCYALLKRQENVSRRPPADIRNKSVWAAASAIAGVMLMTVVATAGDQLLPRITSGGSYTPAMAAVNIPVWLLSVVALAIVALRPPYSMLDLCMIVVLCAWMFDVGLSTVINAGLFDVGFYAGHLYGLFAASVVRFTC